MRLFVHVADAQGFSTAARRLGMPKSTLSRSVSRLEKSLGVQLLHRTTHRVGLTSAGAALIERVRPLLGALGEAVEAVGEAKGAPSGVLRLTAANDLGSVLLGDLVPRFLLRHPKVRVDVRLTNTYIDLVADGIDVALRIGKRLEDSSLIARRLGSLELQVFSAPSYLAGKKAPRTPEGLLSLDWVALRRMKHERFPPQLSEQARVVADDFLFIREALRGGAGVGLLPSFLAREDLERGTLVRLLPEVSEISGGLFFVHPQMQHLPARVNAFKEFLLEQLAEEPLLLS